ncbi:hypothetical protein C0991_000106 [Blastosporella zonata]|nr:hypothetical protein C0991_000106 [Blastosporella zonata]
MTTASKRYHPTPEQIALSEERKAKKLKGVAPAPQNTHTGSIIERSWIPIGSPQDRQRGNQHVKEVDRLEKIIPTLEKAGYAHHYAAGPGKKHGCLIAFKAELYTMISTKTVIYDVERVRDDGDDNARCGRSFHTKNIASLVALQSVSAGKAEGVILRSGRQAGILVRETAKFRAGLDVEDWPCVIGGERADFNFAPDDIAYSLLVGDPILPAQKEVLEPSYVVHVSVDPTVPRTNKSDPGDGNEESGDADKVITSARAAMPPDGLLSITELSEFFARIPRLRSAYDVGLAEVKDLGEVETFGSRVMLGSDRLGRYEPAYTSYTHYWKTTLDYLFVLDPIDRQSNVVALLSPHRTKDLERGLPQKGVSSSDHVSLAAEFTWPGQKKSIEP